MTNDPLPSPSLPPYALLVEQAEWLAPARSRLLRRVGIAHRKHILDLGAGYGIISAELSRRSSVIVFALDSIYKSLHEISNSSHHNISPVNADGRLLPFPDNTFDLIFCQCSLMWINPLDQVIQEICRTVQPGGVLVALEPDYGGLIEYPPSLDTRHLWLSALETAEADPFTGRKLSSLLARYNMTTRIILLDELRPPSPTRFDFLRGLPLTAEQRQHLTKIETLAASIPIEEQVAHLPFFLITAEKRKSE
ncbi:MAG: class I SAM-dependent methyltransferase [Candidatus Promineifilaceae bacterium]